MISKAVPSSIGRYQVIAPLASGGMGELFVARRAAAGGFARTVVLKRLRAELGATASYRSMFFDEARLAARLGHPNVCEVQDLEEAGDDHYLVMPYLEGAPLGAVVGRGPADVAEARLVVGLLVQACDGLEHAHQLTDERGVSLGVVHRDVSPGNVFVTADGVVKLLDFGVAKARDATTVSDQGVVKGKLAYMAPEQLAGGAIDRRADLFALAIVGWEALAGRPLFPRGSPSLTAAAVLDQAIPRVDAVAPEVPAAVADVLASALDRAPHRRPATAAVMRAQLEAAMVAHGGVARAPELATVVAARCGERIAAERERLRIAADEAVPTTTWAAPSTRPAGAAVPAARWPIAAGAIAVAAVAGVIGWRALGARDVVAPRDAATAGAASIDAAAAASPDAGALDGPRAIVALDARPAIDAAASLDTAPRPRKPGRVSIDSTPWAELTIDGRAVGPTPYIDKPLAAGRHPVKARLRDGRERTFTIDVPAGGAAPPVDLRW